MFNAKPFLCPLPGTVTLDTLLCRGCLWITAAVTLSPGYSLHVALILSESPNLIKLPLDSQARVFTAVAELRVSGRGLGSQHLH